MFLGSYLGFIGTVIVSIIAILQNHDYADKEKIRIEKERRNNIQPIFSIDILKLDGMVNDTVETVSLYNTNKRIEHENVEIAIENVGKYPIRNVIVFDVYLYQLLKVNDKK